jgi:hypothetical protein
VWDVVYAKDLRTMDSQVFFPTMSGDEVTLTASDGTQWSLHVASGRGAFVAGVGAVLQGQDVQLDQALYAYAGLRFVVLCPSLPGWSASRDTAVQVRFSGVVTNYTELGATAYTSPAGWGYGPGNNNTTTRLRFPGEASSGSDVNWADTTNVSQVAFRGSEESSVESWVLATVVYGASFNYRGGLYLRTADTAWPAIEDMRPAGATSDGTGHTTPLKVGFYVGSTSDVATYTATGIRVLQKDRPS